MTDFLPQDYEQPQGNSSYMKFKQGENRFRILAKPIVGWLDWQDKKPIRYHMNDKPEKPFDPKKPIKHFWGMLVWNYADEAVQILEVTQISVQSAIGNYAKDEDWGAPFEYDLKVTRTGQDLSTEYSVIASPKKPLSDAIKKAALDKPCYLDALFEGNDPWAVTEKQTELAFTEMPF